MDNGESLVEAVPMPDGLVALVRDFVDELRSYTTAKAVAG